MIRTLLHSNEVPVQDIAARLGANRSTLHRMTAPAAEGPCWPLTFLNRR